MKNLENYKNKKVLVTGGAGFIGSHLVDKLVKIKADVTVIDNLSTGNLNNLENSLFKINFFKGDITNLEDCISATKNIECVFHLAAKTSVPESEKDPVSYNLVNVSGTLNLLQACKKNSVNKFILSSSSAVYGESNFCKEDDLCNPTSIYGLTKLIDEEYCKQYSKYFNCICLRYFNVYGERQTEEGDNAPVVAKFKNLMKQNKEIKIFGTGKQTRDFVSVATVVDANLYSIFLENFNTINVASGQSINLIELVEKLKKEEFSNYKKEIIFETARSGDVKHSNASIEKLKELLS